MRGPGTATQLKLRVNETCLWRKPANSICSMEWYYAAGGRQCGPVSSEQLEELIRSGQVVSNALVWREGMSNWQPYDAVQPAAGPISSAANTAQCAECGQRFSTDELLRYEKTWVCAKCKPVFFQRVKEGAAPPSSLMLWRSDRLLVMSQGAALP